MLTIYNCVTTAHDLKLVALAAAICALASFAAVNLLRHARRASGHMRFVWLAISAVSTGFGIWATHFVGMLAFSPGMPTGYNIVLTMLTLVAAILLTGAGLAVALISTMRGAQSLGGVIVAGGIAAMHYTGMAAFELQASLVWDPVLVTVSIVIGVIIAAIALPVGLYSSQKRWKVGGAMLLTLAICSLHFTGMSAVTIVPDPTVAISPLSIPAVWLAIGVATISFAIIGLALAAIVLDVRDQRQLSLESERMRGLANAAVEGLLVCDGDVIVNVNDSFAALAGSTAALLVGKSLGDCFPDAETRQYLADNPNTALESGLRDVGGAIIPVELIMRPIDFAGRVHQVVAVRDLRARKNSEQHIRFLAHHDALTSLANRGYFNNRLDEEITAAAAHGEMLAVLCLNLDRFKEVNDLFGHAAGDSVLQAVASRVSALLDGRQMMARLGGDEFAILMPGLANPAAASRLADKIIQTLRGDGSGQGTETILTSIGIAICPDDAKDRQTLLNQADTALNRAKLEGRGIYRFFEAKIGAEVRERRLLEHDLRHALANNEMRLVYQPQKDIKSEAITGFEALLRWQHPVRGNVSPALFIPIAEESGSILEIGDWVLKTACREAATWDKTLTVAVNVSGAQLSNANFVQELQQILIDTRLSARQLEIEITETALVRDFNRALNTLRRVKALGVRIAMDDFGTGYSSLSNLRAFPFDKIKIDGSFIKSVHANEQAATIVRAVLGLGRGLGLPVLAEGVETSDEMQFLRDEMCDAVQGYLIGRPSEIGTFAAATRKRSGDVAVAAAISASDADLTVRAYA